MDWDNFDSDWIEEKGYNIVYKNGTTDFREKFILMLKNAIPAYFSTILDEISSSISIALVGHLSSQSELAAIGISETFVLIFFIYPVISNMGAIDTFVSTSYGNKQYYLWGVYLNRALIILTFLSIPFTIVLFFMKEILLYLGQDPQIAEMSQIYFYYRIPTLFVMMYGEILRRFMQAMGYFNLLSILVVVQLVSHIIFLPIFIYGLKMNYLGAAVALGFSNLVGLIVPILYLKFIDPNRLQQI